MAVSSKREPLVSVLMPVWNCEAYVSDAVRSIVAQTCSSWELLAVDGGSTDATLDVIRGFNDDRIRILCAQPGIVNALNYGLNAARGRWVARQDADDMSLPRRLERQLAVFERHESAAFCYTHDELFGDLPPGFKRAKFVRSQALLALRLCFQCPVVHSSVMFSKDMVRECGGYRGEQAEDYDLWGRLIQKGKTIGLSEKLVRTRRHPASASRRHAETVSIASKDIALKHCMQFMSLEPREASRAYAALSAHGTKQNLAEWRWFALGCLPKLRWKSAEMYAWVLWQTAKSLV
jgi:glycosyltransferase involved in cell wall biosynthesis